MGRRLIFGDRRYRFEYVLRSGRVVELPWFVWRLQPQARCRKVVRAPSPDLGQFLEAWSSPPEPLPSASNVQQAIDYPESVHDNEHRLLAAALRLCGREADGTWVVYSDVHGDAIREHLLPVVRSIIEGTDA